MGELEKFKKYLVECEKGVSTQKNYVTNVHDMMEEEGDTLSKEWLSKYREQIKQLYASTTVNNHIAAINQYLKYRGKDWRMNYVRVQKNNYIEESREFLREEYDRLLDAYATKFDDRLCNPFFDLLGKTEWGSLWTDYRRKD